MKRSKFSEAQIAFVLRQAEDGATVGEVCRSSRTARTGISEAIRLTPGGRGMPG